VILIDLAELTFSKNKVIKLIKSKKWLKQYSYLTMKDIKLKQYFKEEMKNQITIENLKKYWETELK